jgi:xanthine dehydrogenase YagT iron-sulfur-binding subunit
VNGQARAIEADSRATLLDMLRKTLHLTWTKEGCDHGQCGACIVHVNGRQIDNCLALAVMQQDTEITTKYRWTGQSASDAGRFCGARRFQCGYCISG